VDVQRTRYATPNVRAERPAVDSPLSSEGLGRTRDTRSNDFIETANLAAVPTYLRATKEACHTSIATPECDGDTQQRHAN